MSVNVKQRVQQIREQQAGPKLPDEQLAAALKRIVSKLRMDKGEGMLSIATDEAVQMLEAGWTVRYEDGSDKIQWITPSGITSRGMNFLSESLDKPPADAVHYAERQGHIKHRFRVPKQ